MTIFSTICNYYSLDDLKAPPQLLTGGFMHANWRLSTARGDYVLKRYGEYSEEVKQSFLQTELIAQHFAKQNILTRTACPTRENNFYVTIENQLYVLFPWLENNRDISITSLPCVKKIALLLFQLHHHQPANINVHSPWPNELMVDWHEIVYSHNRHSTLSPLSVNECEQWQKKYEMGIAHLSSQRVISHRDFYQSNVIWNAAQQPILIDWDDAGEIHPLVELFNVAINWAGLPDNQFDIELYQHVIDSYQDYLCDNVDINEAVIYASLMSWFEWLVFNVKRLAGVIPATTDQQSKALAEAATARLVINKLIFLNDTLHC